MELCISHYDGRQGGFSVVSKWKQFHFGGIEVYKPFPAPFNHRLEVFLEAGGQVRFVNDTRFTIEVEVNSSAVCIDAYLGTDDIGKVISEDQEQCRT